MLQLYSSPVVVWSDLKNKHLVPLPVVPYARINRLPLTSNVVRGAVVLIPTLPFDNIIILSVGATFVVFGLVENTISPVSAPDTDVISTPISAQLKSDEVGE
jgi:hypothetical protein